MPIKTVEEVIIRIIAINRDLNEESLNSLLIASGWEKADIDNDQLQRCERFVTTQLYTRSRF